MGKFEKEGDMTELEEKIIHNRMEDIEDESTRGDIDELIERI